MQGKSTMRQKYVKQRNTLSIESIQCASHQICNHIIESLCYQRAKKIFTFVSMGAEVDTTSIILNGLDSGKIMAVPKVYPIEKRMIFSQIKSLNDLQKGHFGVLEPSSSLIVEEESDENTVFIIPGLVFDLAKHRIGYGGGYYDRYLAKVPKPLATIGVAYDFQVITYLPTDPHDIALDWIVTEKVWR